MSGQRTGVQPGFLAMAMLVLVITGCGGKDSPERKMYVCGYDRCRDSTEYSDFFDNFLLNIWNNPGRDRGGVHHTASHGDEIIVIAEQRESDGPGGLWYDLKGGGWVEDRYVTDEVCTPENLETYSFTNCLMGEY